MVMTEESICTRVLVERTNEYQRAPLLNARNEHNSPIYDILNTCKSFDIYDICIDMITRGCYLGKQEWSKKMWDIAWTKEDEEY